ncbi:hypothetical protein COO60DRAFT_382576 [Scenedesmus sp. NREL 46B-D3]|nr:hypothetical protein COO60DRAFT_382576 [Scenedesmus sp. NREL 46B-D3]
MPSHTKPHNIVVCCDGTWCGAETGTRGNIQIIADGFASQGQNAYVKTQDGKPVYNSYTNTDICYFNGAGLDGLEDLAKKGKRLPALGLLGGFGDTLLYIANGVIANDLPERCKEAYSFIVDKFKGPDASRVWLFGLSRGAYTVRAVAGMVNNCGILKPAAAGGAAGRRNELQDVWQMYRSDHPDDSPKGTNAQQFRSSRSWPRGALPHIIFMGLLDTVGAEGIPRIKPRGDAASAFTYKYSFRDVVVSSEVQHVFQAASTHDRLAPFEACPVRRSGKLAQGSSTRHYPGAEFSMLEVWYPGAHYDVGRQDFVFSNRRITNTLFRVLNPLRTNVACTPELADYPLLGRALPAHGGPSRPPRLIGVPSTAVDAQAAAPGQSSAGTSSSSSSSSAGIAANGRPLGSDWCLVAQVNKLQPGMLPEADDSAWEDLVKGGFAELTSNGTGQSRLGLTSVHSLCLLWPLCGSLLLALLQAGTCMMLPAAWVLQKLAARLRLRLPLFRPAYTIDAETKILQPLVNVLAYLLDAQPGLLLKDRVIPLPTKADTYGLPNDEAAFFPVPLDKDFNSYKPGGRKNVEWFMSETYLNYEKGLRGRGRGPAAQ